MVTPDKLQAAHTQGTTLSTTIKTDQPELYPCQTGSMTTETTTKKVHAHYTTTSGLLWPVKTPVVRKLNSHSVTNSGNTTLTPFLQHVSTQQTCQIQIRGVLVMASYGHCSQHASITRPDPTSCIQFSSILPKKAPIILCKTGPDLIWKARSGFGQTDVVQKHTSVQASSGLLLANASK